MAAVTVCTVRSTVPPQHRAEMAQWQREEHVPRLLGVPGYLGVQRFEMLDDDCSFMNVWTMRSRAAFDSPEHDAASHTPWQIRMRGLRTVQLVDFYEPAESGPWSSFPPDTGRYLLRCDLLAPQGLRDAALAAWLSARWDALSATVPLRSTFALRDLDRPDSFLLLAFHDDRKALAAAMAVLTGDAQLSAYRAVTPPLSASDPTWRELAADPSPR